MPLLTWSCMILSYTRREQLSLGVLCVDLEASLQQAGSSWARVCGILSIEEKLHTSLPWSISCGLIPLVGDLCQHSPKDPKVQKEWMRSSSFSRLSGSTLTQSMWVVIRFIADILWLVAAVGPDYTQPILVWRATGPFSPRPIISCQ